LLRGEVGLSKPLGTEQNQRENETKLHDQLRTMGLRV
jgi:hypothetical protein